MSKIEVILILICILICGCIRSARADAPHSIKLQKCNFKFYNNYDKAYYYKKNKKLVYWNTSNNKACYIII